MRAPRVLAVDIGAGHVACGVFGVGASGRLVLQQFALEPHSSDPTHENRWAVEIAQSLGAIVTRRKLAGSAAIAVPGHLALTKFIKTPSVAKEKRVKIVAFEAAENIPYPLEEVVWDHLVVADDGFDLEVMLTAVKFDAMQALCGAADAAGFPVERALPAGLALCHAFRYNYPKVIEPVIVVNVGARTTNLLFVEGDRFYIRTLALAGNAMTQAISEELRIDFAAAETLKIQVLSGQSDLPIGSPSRAAVQRAASSFCSRLQLEITRSAVNHRRHSGGGAAVALYLTGGGSLIEELPGTLAEKLRIPVERYEALKNVDVAADARAAGAEGAAQVLADLVGLATRLVVPTETEASLLPPALTAALAFRKKQPLLLAAAALATLALAPPAYYLHRLATATEERVSQYDGQLMPLRSVQNRNEENLRQIVEARKQINALTGAYETKANWVNFFTDLQQRLVAVEDVWLDRLQVLRPAAPEPDAAPPEPPPTEPVPADGQPAAAPAADPVPPPKKGPTIRLALSGRLLDVRNPQSKVSPESLQRVKELLAGFTDSKFITAVENERFDTNQNGLLHFDFTLVINPKQTL
ncbi:MAG: pilus assembly protein PilM [Verrucomicrobia bacterium]|nr:pilus assembly protein PilM [Verrucomicrobiota bacterium]